MFRETTVKEEQGNLVCLPQGGDNDNEGLATKKLDVVQQVSFYMNIFINI